MLQPLPTKLTPEQITAMCQRGFGKDVKIKTIQEISGGTFNETYLIKFPGKAKAVLRAAPPHTSDLFWDEVALMRREHAMYPYFAAVGSLMPKILLADFTHQLVGRDYLFQTVMEGERWSDIEDDLTPEENLELWRQCGTLVKQIHTTTGEWFGFPYPGFHSKWSDVILERFIRISQSMEHYQVKIPAFERISRTVQANTLLLDEIVLPRLLHGDLWTFNLLVTRTPTGPQITGVLDADRAWWGDPMADWIMFLFSLRQEDPEWTERITAFNEGYGPLETVPTTESAIQFRQTIYKAMHIGMAAIWGAKREKQSDVTRATMELQQLAQVLSG
ncbi:MAG TPA: aminoglycoside phosphotransferase family protein [Anaerolineales bacterium]|nr:aminoglycoside phosphotransferase family protein [Anaerolineales bacterium]